MKEGFCLVSANKVVNQAGAIREFEKPEVSEAIKIVNANKWLIGLSPTEWDDREARLKKEYEKNHIKCGDPILGSPLSAVEGIKLKWKDNKNTSENPALAEAASQFNDALLDEQAKKIEKLANENKRLKDQIAVLDAYKKHNDKIDRLQIKRLGKEIARLNGIIHDKNEEIKHKTKGCCELITENVDLKKKLSDKNAVLADVAEELRLSKIREKNLTELCQKYIKANEELKEKLADKVVDKIDAQALKSAESALAYKEKVIAEKNEVIVDLARKLNTQKDLVDDISLKYDGAKHNLKLRMDECEKLEKELDEVKKQNTAVMVDMTAKCLRAARESINDVFESYAAKYAKSTLDELKENAYNSFNAKAHNLGLVGSKDGNGIIDQLVGVDIAEECGDHSGVIVLCGKDFVDAIKKMK